MAGDSVVHRLSVEVIDSVPRKIPAGTAVAMKVRACCKEACDLRGSAVEVVTSEGEAVTAELLEFREGWNNTAEFTVPTPSWVGRHTWALLLKSKDGEGAHDASFVNFTFETEPHVTSLAVWDVPSPVIEGSRFSVRVGAKCLAGCVLTGKEVEVRDEQGRRIGRVRLGEAPFPGTGGLYWADVTLVAPDGTGVVRWSLRFPEEPDKVLPHSLAAAQFSFATVHTPMHEVTVHVLEKESREPIGDAQVRVGAFRSSTDSEGRAIVSLPEGEHHLVVWKPGYESPSEAVHVMGDMRIQVEVVFVPEPPEWENYY